MTHLPTKWYEILAYKMFLLFYQMEEGTKAALIALFLVLVIIPLGSYLGYLWVKSW